MDSDIVVGNEMDRGATKCLSFKSCTAKKSEGKSTHFRSSGAKKRGQKRNLKEDPFVLINVGVMRFASPDVTTPIPGKTLPLKIKKDSSCSEVFAEALVTTGLRTRHLTLRQAGKWFTRMDSLLFPVSLKMNSLWERTCSCFRRT